MTESPNKGPEHPFRRNSTCTPASNRHGSLDDTSSLDLTRTRSLEPAAIESIVIPPETEESKPDDEGERQTSQSWPSHTKYLILFASFITSLSFGVTQVPLLYVFRLMTCDAYYEKHPTNVHPHVAVSGISSAFSFWSFNHHAGPTYIANDRCSIHPIESSTALSISLLGASTTIFGLLNLFLTGFLIKRIGVKPTLVIQIFFPAIRLFVQNVGVEVWGNLGIIIIQCSQIVSVIGGPSGYMLALNTFITEIVEFEGRTAALGRLTGSMMFGAALGFLLGGVVAELFGIRAPFRVTFVLFLSSCAYSAVFLPHIPPAAPKTEGSSSDTKRKGLLQKFFGPLGCFAPQKFVTADGTVRTEYGAFLLACGVFLGILATGYLPTLLQLYATDVFTFGTRENGWLIFQYSALRGIFLTFAFPTLIAVGRKWTSKRGEDIRQQESESDEQQPLLSRTESRTTETVDKGEQKQQTFTFDLTYTRFSLIADGLLTLLCSFVREGWQMYLVATVLPLAAGTSSAAKGTILQMVGSSASSSERTDALAGVSLVENMARLSTTFVFGVIFAAFTSVGRTELVFTCNAAVAIIGFVVLILARFPPEGSRRLGKT